MTENDVARLLDVAGPDEVSLVGLRPRQVVQPDGPPVDEPLHEARRVVFGDELGAGTVLFLRCHGSACQTQAPSCRGPRGERADHRVTITRLRRRGNGLSGVVVDADGVDRPWTSDVDEVVTVAADTLPAEAAVGTGTPAADEYRVRVWPSRRWGVVGAWGFRAQLDHVTNWGEHGDAPLLPGPGQWHPGQDEAVAWAVAEARQIHAGGGCCYCHQLDANPQDLPLVVHAGGAVLIDERPARPATAPTGGEVR